MKLTKVEMYGFKSFAERTEFAFGDGITAIVGPNGCGKSNLVDALQWTLGEQRPTRLRSSGMEDVVFRGEAASVDHAEVSLTFDNSDQRLPLPAAEVKITRRLHRGAGESEYLVNERPARLKDVRDLFLDTGLGVGGYSFMAQGQIDAILRASPAERRVLIEEAAGTSRYRVRRKEAVRRLDRTEQDLQRAGDLLAELERQVRSLKVQAGRARTFVEKRDRMRGVIAVLFARRRRDLEALLAGLCEQRESAAARESAARAELALAEESLGARDEQQSAIAAAISDLRTLLAERRARGDHLAARLVDLDERRALGAAEREEGDARRREVAEQIAVLERAEGEASARAVEVTARERERREAKALAQRRTHELARAAQELEGELAELEREELDRVEEEQRARSELADVESHWRALGQARRKLEERSSERARAIAEVAEAARAARRKLAGLAADRAAIETELSADDDELGRLFAERHSLSERLRHREARVEGERSRLNVVEEAIARHEGVSEVVRRLLERAAHGDPELAGLEGIVADVVTAPAETARALEAALGPLAEALVVADRPAANRILRLLRTEGLERIHILARAEIPDGDAAGGGGAERNELLRASTFDGRDRALLAALLGRFDLLESGRPMEEAAPAPGRALVSPEGEVMLSRYESVSRGRGEFLGLITRRNERERLERAVKSGEEESAALRARLAALHGEVAERELNREARARRRAEAQAIEADAEKAVQGVENRLALLREELAVDAREAVDLGRRCATLQDERGTLAAKRAAVEAKRLDARARRGRVAQELQGGAAERQRAEEAALALDVEVAQLAERAKAAQEAREAARARVRERHEELTRAERRLAELADEEARLAEARELAAREREQLARESEAQHAELAAKQGELERHKHETGGLRHRVHELRSAVEEASREAQGVALREQEQRLHFEMLAGKVREELLLEPDDLVAQVRAVEEGGGRSIVLPPPPIEPPPPAEPPAAAAADGAAGTSSAVDGAVPPAAATPLETPLPPPPPPQPIEVELDRRLFGTPLDLLQSESDRLRGTLARLGPVNVTAIEELQAVEGRATFLQRQRHDLTEARQRLRAMIAEIDHECETRFSSTYDAVREHFRHLFRRLFGGGRADLTRVETDDPAETGVDIVAAPPGKDPRSIAMLSGGERTLTAAALLFALFSTRPSPFCVLDEVDAALDEANVERYTLMVRDFLKSTQFLIVTHNKRTMAVADTLYGVTMEGNGISRPIAMRFEQEKVREHAGGA